MAANEVVAHLFDECTRRGIKVPGQFVGHFGKVCKQLLADGFTELQLMQATTVLLEREQSPDKLPYVLIEMQAKEAKGRREQAARDAAQERNRLERERADAHALPIEENRERWRKMIAEFGRPVHDLASEISPDPPDPLREHRCAECHNNRLLVPYGSRYVCRDCAAALDKKLLATVTPPGGRRRARKRKGATGG